MKEVLDFLELTPTKIQADIEELEDKLVKQVDKFRKWETQWSGGAGAHIGACYCNSLRATIKELDSLYQLRIGSSEWVGKKGSWIQTLFGLIKETNNDSSKKQD